MCMCWYTCIQIEHNSFYLGWSWKSSNLLLKCAMLYASRDENCKHANESTPQRDLNENEIE